MHIVFIYPSMAEKETYRAKVRKGVVSTWSMEPLTIAALKGVTPAHHQTTFFDDRIEDIDFDKEEIVNKIYRHGLKIYASFVIGYDEDDAGTVSETLKYAIDKGFFIANFYQLTPFPGTGLYERLKTENRLLNEKWWLDENFRYGDVVFQPAKITAQEMTMLCHKAKEKFYSFGSILKRGFKFRINRNKLSHFVLFFIINLLTRQEMIKRKNRKLGRA